MVALAITSIGSLVGTAVLDSISDRRKDIKIIGYNSTPEAINNFRSDRCYLIPPTSDRDIYSDTFASYLKRDQPDLVIPGRDEDIDILAELRATGGLDRTTIIAPSPQVVALLNDKYETYRFAERHGLPFARTAIDVAGAKTIAATTGYPIITKQRSGGHASRGVYVCRNDRDLESAAADGGRFLYQEFLGRPDDIDGRLPRFDFGVPWFFAYREESQYSSQMLIDENGRILSSFSVVSHFEHGRSLRVETVDEPALEAVGKAYARALGEIGCFGPLNVQCKKLRDGSFVCFELNGRFVGGTYARALLGYREVEFLIDYVVHGKVPPPGPYGTPGTFVMRPPTSVLMDNASIETLRRDGLWVRQESPSSAT